MASELRRARDQARKDKRREELLAVAGRLFAEKGYHATIISDIAGEAGVGQGTIYRHFKDKRDMLDNLFEQLIEKLFMQFTEMTSRPPSNEAEYRQASVVALERVVAVLDQERELANFFIREGPSIDRDFAEKMSGIYERFAMLAKYYLDQAIAAGFARPCDSSIVSQALVGIAVWMANLWCAGRVSDVSRDKLVAEAVDLAFKGFGRSAETAVAPHTAAAAAIEEGKDNE